MPAIEPLKQAGYEYPQSQTNILPKLPVRALVFAPGSGGKSTMITRLLVDKQFYGGKFSRIYWFSPSATVDDGLDPLREYVQKLQDQEEDPTFHDGFDPEFIQKLLDMQKNYFSMREETRRLENKLRPRLDNWIRASQIRKQLIKCATKRMTKSKAMKAAAKTATKTKAIKATATTQGQRQRWLFS